jgi:hypothetical protein
MAVISFSRVRRDRANDTPSVTPTGNVRLSQPGNLSNTNWATITCGIFATFSSLKMAMTSLAIKSMAMTITPEKSGTPISRQM